MQYGVEHGTRTQYCYRLLAVSQLEVSSVNAAAVAATTALWFRDAALPARSEKNECRSAYTGTQRADNPKNNISSEAVKGVFQIL